MTEQEKKAETARLAAEAKAKEDKEKADAEFEDSIADLSDEEKEAKRQERGSNNDNEPDYEAQLKAERDAREKAEKALAGKRFHDSQRKRKNDDDDGEDKDDEDPDGEEDDKPLTKKDLHNALAVQEQKLLKETQAERIQEIARGLTDNPAKVELIVEIHKNRIWPSSVPLRQQIEEAAAIADRRKLVSVNKELTRALKGKDGLSRDAGGAHQDGMQGTAPKMAASDEASLKRAGYVYDNATRVWKKKLPSGKYLIKKDIKSRPILTK